MDEAEKKRKKAEYMKKYWAMHPRTAEGLAQAREYAREHRAENNARVAAWRADNLATAREQSRLSVARWRAKQKQKAERTE